MEKQDEHENQMEKQGSTWKRQGEAEDYVYLYIAM